MQNRAAISYKIMVVDDDQANLRLLERIFRQDYQVISASSGTEALKLLEQHDVAVIITDQRMPDISGLELLKSTAESRPFMVRIVLTGHADIESLVDSINCGYIYKFLTKPLKPFDLRLTVTRALEHHEAIKARHELEVTNARLSVKINDIMSGFIRAIADALDAKDKYAHGHARRVSNYALAIGKRFKFDDAALEDLYLAAFLHDIGKIGTPDNILLKPGPFSDEERNLVKLHAERGARILASIPGMEEVSNAVLHHHEHFDGSGYPEGLFSELIPLASRIILVADAYDSFTSPRPFRETGTHQMAIEKLKAGSGTQFDPDIVDVFCGIEAIGRIRQCIAEGNWYKSIFLSRANSRADVDELSIEELVHEIETNPISSFLALCEANNENVEDPTDSIVKACAQLGEVRLRKIASLYSGQLDSSLEEVFAHSLRCAIAARLIAQKTGIINVDSAYSMGLFHDIGQIFLHVVFPSYMDNISLQPANLRTKEEIFAFGVDHAQIGQWILDAAGMSRSITSSVQSHHDWMVINEPTALLLHFANTLAHVDDPYKVDILGSDRLSILGITRGDLVNIGASIAAALKQLPATKQNGFQTNISLLPEYVPAVR
jgi:putative two-component system response regulator